MATLANLAVDIAAGSGRIPEGALARWAMQLLLMVLRGIPEMCRRSGLVISREQGLRYDAGFAVPVLMSRWGVTMGRFL